MASLGLNNGDFPGNNGPEPGRSDRDNPIVAQKTATSGLVFDGQHNEFDRFAQIKVGRQDPGRTLPAPGRLGCSFGRGDFGDWKRTVLLQRVEQSAIECLKLDLCIFFPR